MTDTPQINAASRDWKIVEEWAQKRLTQLRLQLEAQAMDERQTAVIRGRIAELKALVKLGEPTPEPIPDDDELAGEGVNE